MGKEGGGGGEEGGEEAAIEMQPNAFTVTRMVTVRTVGRNVKHLQRATKALQPSQT